jgi:hypothetical protein
MSAYLLVGYDSESSRTALNKLLERLYHESVSVVKYPRAEGIILPGDKELAILLASWSAFTSDFEGSLRGLVVPFLSERFLALVEKGETGTLPYLYEAMAGQNSFYDGLLDFVEGIDEETLLTVKTYIETGGSPSLSALRLYVHHNTVSYRLQRFAEKTGLGLETFADKMFVYELIRAYNRKNGPFSR